MTAREDLINIVCQQIEAAGFSGDVSAVAASVLDIAEGVNRIEREILPRLASRELEKSLAHELVVDWIVELEHIGRHVYDAVEQLVSVREHLAEG